MKCPQCNSEKLSVLDSRSDGTAIRRRRQCTACEFRFTTYERVELSLPIVVKKGGAREPFSRDKLKAGLVQACGKRPVSSESIEDAVCSIEKRVSELTSKEIDSRSIGDFVMDLLKGLDEVAYIRFASVYREFSDVHDFQETLKGLSTDEVGQDKRVGNA